MRRTRGPAALATAAILALAMAACGGAAASPSPTASAFPIGPTGWPSGTTGQYGLRIDPTLLGQLPKFAGAAPLVEDPQSESEAMDDADLAKTLDRYAAGTIGSIDGADWANVAIGHFRVEDVPPETYTGWVEQYADGACSQADGVADTSQSVIGHFTVDTATCGGALRVYTLALGNGIILSLYDFGPKQLGRKFIEAIY